MFLQDFHSMSNCNPAEAGQMSAQCGIEGDQTRETMSCDAYRPASFREQRGKHIKGWGNPYTG